MLTSTRHRGTRGLAAAAVSLSILCALSAGSKESTFVTGQIRLDERTWGRGSVPTLTFSTGGGLLSGTVDKVAAFLYFSDQPNAFSTTPFPPVFAGEIPVPGSIVVPIFVPPGRGPINEHTREAFIQGAVFDVTDPTVPLALTNETYLDIVYESAPVFFEIDHETEDDFTTGLANGQSVSTPPEFGRLLSISALQPSSGPQHFGAAIFDSSPGGPNAVGEDPDLLVDLGNLLILQETCVQSAPDIFEKPDDAAGGGTLVFDFTGFDFIEKVEPRSLVLVDIDADAPAAQVQPLDVTVRMTDVLGHQRVYSVTQGWTEDITRFATDGFRVLDLTTLAPQPGFLAASVATGVEHPEYLPGEVVRLEVEFLGSGAVDALVFSREADPIGSGGKRQKQR